MVKLMDSGKKVISSEVSNLSENRIPPTVTWGVVAICILPFFLNLLGLDFSTFGEILTPDQAGNLSQMELFEAMHNSLEGSFVHTLLEWSAVCTAVLIVLLSLMDYSLRGDPITPVLGVALFFAGMMDGFHTLAANHLLEIVAPTNNLIPFTWAICRLFHALIMIIGVSLLIGRYGNYKHINPKQNLGFILIISGACGLLAYGLIYFTSTQEILPQTTYPDALLTRPWDFVPMLLFIGAGIWVYPKFYNCNPSPFSYALIISAIPNAATQAYMTFGSTALFDNAFNIAHFLKILAYLVPLIGIAIEYIQIYQRQARSLFADLQKSLGFIKNLVNEVLDSTRFTVAITRSGEELEAMMGKQLQSTTEVIHTVQAISGRSQELVKTVGEIEADFEKLRLSCSSLSTKLGAIAEQAGRITRITSTIDNIAKQTKFLAINASIQAISSEQHQEGQGFNIIAKEINALASQTRTTAQAINPIVQDMQAAVANGVEEMNTFTDAHVQAITPRISLITQGIREQVLSAQKIRDEIAQLGSSSEETSDYLRHTLQQTNDTLAQLQMSVENLQQELNRFSRDPSSLL
ncbi:methyl-accepting chemotaxis protein [Sodalinema gerasimenkoae]|uniref:methyl-accepting chemotaxis protein n=1 Tax=Sodalinema gerasimenkoae TaxID=2862348 RepID=UPI001C9365D9|nr:methyl-accepting chemotaxis protein [Sodalinema gerasimenkoae]